MPKDTTSPFTPGLPVAVEFFVGRLAEIQRLEQKIRDAVNARRIQVAFMTGERGIGKTSLATFVRILAERNLSLVSAHAFLGGAYTLEEMTRRVFDYLLKDNLSKPWFSKLKGLFGRHIQEVGLFGVTVGFRAAEGDLAQLARHFPEALRNINSQLGDDKHGLLIVLDDINGLASSEEFANWLKSVVDEIATSGAEIPVCILLVGLQERRQALIDLQPSLARIFDTVEIKPWTQDETELFFANAFQTAGITLESEARATMAFHAGGLPVLAHEIGDAVFRQDHDGIVSQDDAMEGIFAAAEIVGRKYLEPQVLTAVRSRRYRSILAEVGNDHFGFNFTRAELLRSLESEEDKRVLDNFLKRMTELGVIVREPERGQGEYRFANWRNFLYLWFFPKESGDAEEEA